MVNQIFQRLDNRFFLQLQSRQLLSVLFHHFLRGAGDKILVTQLGAVAFDVLLNFFQISLEFFPFHIIVDEIMHKNLQIPHHTGSGASRPFRFGIDVKSAYIGKPLDHMGLRFQIRRPLLRRFYGHIEFLPRRNLLSGPDLPHTAGGGLKIGENPEKFRIIQFIFSLRPTGDKKRFQIGFFLTQPRKAQLRYLIFQLLP